jgi:hypothetical protein
VSRSVARMALGVLVFSGTGSVLLMFREGSYRREDWRQAAAYVEQYYQPGDQFMFERKNVMQSFLRYLEIDDQKPVGIIMMSSVPEEALPNARPIMASRVWVIYRNPNENVHRQGVMPDFDPFEPGRSRIGDWLSTRRGQVLEQKKFNGVTVLLVDVRPEMVVSSTYDSSKNN